MGMTQIDISIDINMIIFLLGVIAFELGVLILVVIKR